MQEDVFALPPSRPRQGRPCGGLAIAGNEPPKGAESLALDLLWACHAGNGGLVLSPKFRRAKVSADADTRPLANAHIPNGLAVPGDLPMQVGRAMSSSQGNLVGCGGAFVAWRRFDANDDTLVAHAHFYLGRSRLFRRAERAGDIGLGNVGRATGHFCLKSRPSDACWS